MKSLQVTRMPSSRMRTVCCSGCLVEGGVCLGVSAWGGICLEGGVSPGGCTPPPVDRILDTCLWKHYLSATSFADGNDGSFGCPIITKKYYSQCYFVHKHLNNAWYSQAHSLIGKVSKIIYERHNILPYRDVVFTATETSIRFQLLADRHNIKLSNPVEQRFPSL